MNKTVEHPSTNDASFLIDWKESQSKPVILIIFYFSLFCVLYSITLCVQLYMTVKFTDRGKLFITHDT